MSTTLYGATNTPSGWLFTSSDGHIMKTITLAPKSWKLEAAYQLDASETLFVRHGLSPDLYDLLKNGQHTLADADDSNGIVTLSNTNYAETVSGAHRLRRWRAQCCLQPGGGWTTTRAAAPSSSPATCANQAQTHQVEIFGTNAFNFAIEFRAGPF